MWPRGDLVHRLVDVGSGDGRFLQWMIDRFNPAAAIGTDMVEWEWVPGPDVPFLKIDATKLHAHPGLRQFRPDLVTFVNSLAYMGDWRAALKSASILADAVLVFDNLIDPTPAWRMATKYANPIPNSALVAWADQNGMWVAGKAGGDIFHRRLFLKTPEWMHPAVAVLTAFLDFVASYVVRPEKCRHSAWLLVRK